MIIDQEFFFEYGIIPVIVLLHSKQITNIDFNSQEPEFSIMSVCAQQT